MCLKHQYSSRANLLVCLKHQHSSRVNLLVCLKVGLLKKCLKHQHNVRVTLQVCLKTRTADNTFFKTKAAAAAAVLKQEYSFNIITQFSNNLTGSSLMYIIIIIIIYPLTARVAGASQMISQNSSLHFFLFSTALWDLVNSSLSIS